MKKLLKILLLAAFLGPLSVWGQEKIEVPAIRISYKSNEVYQPVVVKPVQGVEVKNVILMIGDGMGLTHLSTAWVANKGQLNVDNCTSVGLVRTYAYNKLITDSGASGTAMATGEKANYHSIGVDTDNNELPSITDLARNNGLSTGVVVTCGLTDATPATFCASNPDRDQEEEIALDFLNCGVDFLFGGGRSRFNERTDNRNLLQEMAEKGYQICTTWEETDAVSDGKVFAVLEDGQLPLAPERGDLFLKATEKALEMLSKNENGFFAMLEGSRIDDCGHWNDLPGLIAEINDFDKTIGQVLQWAEKDGETLVVILADHETGALTLTDGDISEGEVTVNFANKSHSGIMVPVYAYGPQAQMFTGIMENTDVFHKIKEILDL